MDNYEFCTQWVVDQEPRMGARVLDYGCGAGTIVKELRRRDVEAFGCDVFYEGGDYSTSIDASLLAAGVIRRMHEGKIPFECSTFDIIINNQVMEHVENIDAVLHEMHRVLKPGGTILSLFPDKGVWREGHCGIPFLHWFPKRSRTRILYAAGLRALGLGYFKGEKGIMEWSREFCAWLDRWTHYRKRSEIAASYRSYFSDLRHIEDHWLRRRLAGRRLRVTWLPAGVQRLIARKLGCLVFVARKAT